MEDGRVLCAVAEERFSRAKKDGRFPSRAFEFVDKEGIDVLCVSTTTNRSFAAEYERLGIVPDQQILRERAETLRSIARIENVAKRTVFVNHHDCHAASAFYFSGFSEALVVTWDAGNNSEPWNFTAQIGNGNGLHRVEESRDGSPGLNYTAITAIIGLRPGHHEGKVTGLAGFGELREGEVEKVRYYLSRFDADSTSIGTIATWRNVGSSTKIPVLEVDESMVSKAFGELGICKENLASIIQRLTEEKVLQKIEQLRRQFDAKRICLAGGLFANVLLNKKIKELGFSEIYIHPAMGDDGLALGACAHALGREGIRPFAEDTVFWGPSFGEKDTEKALVAADLTFEKSDDIEAEIAEILQQGGIVGRFSGGMEYGPRALGNRSILCEATDPAINGILNGKLRRTEYMPFAPITLEEDYPKCFSETGRAMKAMRFMTIAVDCTEQCKSETPAIVHVDGTARPQIVGTENPGLRRILGEYRARTGVSALINTSFNVHEQPIVCTPTEAIVAFQQSQIDCLALGNFLVRRRQ